MTTTLGGSSEPPPPPELTSECAIQDAVGPNCQGRVVALSFNYVGSDCGASVHTQDSEKAKCAGDPELAELVRIRAFDPKNVDRVYLDTDPAGGASVMLGDAVELLAQNAGQSRMAPKTMVEIFDSFGTLLQSLEFHTSCSQPLNVGDQFGSLALFAMTTTEGGTVGLGTPVEYTYSITNTGDADVFNITVEDAFVPPPVTGSPIGLLTPGETIELTTTAFILEETTNTVTVSGAGGSSASVCTATDSSIVRIVDPPPLEICTTKVQAMTLVYIGPDNPGAEVMIIADRFNDPTNWVAYDVDLAVNVSPTAAAENGHTIDATAHGQLGLGANTSILINGIEERLHTSCSAPFVTGEPAPLSDPKGDPSPNWAVVSFTQK